MSVPPVQVLYVQNQPAEVETIRAVLDRASADSPKQPFSLQAVDTIAQALDYLKRHPIDLILTALHLPDSSGLATVATLRISAPDTPIIVLADEEDDSLAVRAVHAGAQDFLFAPQLYSAQLVPSMRYALERSRTETMLARRARELETLHNISLAINAENDLHQLLNLIVENASRISGIAMAGLYLLVEDGNALELAVMYNVPDHYRGTRIKPGEGLAGKVLQSGQPMAVQNYPKWESASPHYRGNTFGRVLAVPMRAAGKTIGVINVSDLHIDQPFSQEEIWLISLFADQAAIAIEKARLFESERAQRQLAEALRDSAAAISSTLNQEEVFNRLLDNVEKVVGQHAVSLSLVERGSARVVRTRGYPSLELEQAVKSHDLVIQETPGLRWMQEHKKALAIPDVRQFWGWIPRPETEWICSYAGAPIFARGNLIGFLHLQSSQVGALTTADAEVLQAFADHAGIALENARMYNEIQQLAIVDDLTGLYNRRGFFTLAEQQIRLARRTQRNSMLIYLDVDGLKGVNDRFGHQAGDDLLVEAAGLLKETFRASDIVARMGGDEFAVFAIESPGHTVEVLCGRLLQKIEAANRLPNRRFFISISYGAANLLDGHIADLDELIREADGHMYQQKREKYQNGKQTLAA